MDTQSTVRLVAQSGGDWLVVDAARQSFDRELGPGSPLTERDKRLLKFLATGLEAADRKVMFARMIACADEDTAELLFDTIQSISRHEQPFAHPQMTLKIRAPLAAARQLWKTNIGMAGGDASQPAWSEMSLRYVDRPPAFYLPEEWRERADSVKQGSGGRHPDSERIAEAFDRMMQQAGEHYMALLAMGVAPEMARLPLPAATMVSWTWTGSLLAWARLCRLRLDDHAQAESREVAEMIAPILSEWCPVSFAALVPLYLRAAPAVA